jgi:uncharacterized membrane protein
MTIYRYFLFASLFAISACKKAPVSIPPKNTANPYAQADVYLAGETTTACYWKNGVPTYLSGNYANAIAVVGSDVYVAGVSPDINDSRAAYWKNGVDNVLPGAGGVAYGITIYGNDVYVVGTISDSLGYRACYWKNGVMTKLTGGFSFYTARANAIAINSNGVHIAGCICDNSGNYVPTYWRNGIPRYLKGYTSSTGANAIALNDTDVYIAGSLADSGTHAVYWKNGILNKLDNTIYPNSGASNIIINRNDVYVAGFVCPKPPGQFMVTAYWKNGILTALPLTPSIQSSFQATAIAVNNNDVYITGEMWPHNGFWNNGVTTQLDQTLCQITAIVVVPH